MINDRNVRHMDKMKTLPLILLLAVPGALTGALTGCAAGKPDRSIADQINAEMTQAVEQRSKSASAQSAQADAVSQALLPPMQIAMPRAGAGGKSLDSRFDLVVNNAAASQVFMGIVSGTRYSMLVHPEVTGAISVNLKDVSVFEALNAIRELYGYEYRVEGTRISIQPLTIQTRIFQVNYLTGQRRGTSEVRVTAPSGISSGTSGASGTTTPTTTTTGGGQSSSVTTTSSSDFWAELTTALTAIVGTGSGRQVVVSAQTGVVVVRALPDELRNVAAYLKASRLSSERQVILEAKILEVRLSDGYQQGVNWAAFNAGSGSRTSIGQTGPNASLTPTGTLTGPLLGTTGITPGRDFRTPATAAVATGVAGGIAGAAGGIFGLAFQTSNFAALLSFLETQGTVHVLSSPRIATLNNQKAVLKVGQDELFVTGVSGGTAGTANVASTEPTVTLQSFFSGISLDVTPRIDADDNIILHVHPSISRVTPGEVRVTLRVGEFTLPTPISSTQETDSIVRAQDGQIVAIGGLMSQRQTDDRSQLPGTGSLGGLFGQKNRGSEKSELVILLKPTIIRTDSDWAQDIQQSRERMRSMERSEKSENSEKPGSRE